MLLSTGRKARTRERAQGAYHRGTVRDGPVAHEPDVEISTCPIGVADRVRDHGRSGLVGRLRSGSGAARNAAHPPERQSPVAACKACRGGAVAAVDEIRAHLWPIGAWVWRLRGWMQPSTPPGRSRMRLMIGGRWGE